MLPRSLPLCQVKLNLKGSILLMICILLTTIFYCLLSDPKPTIHDLMTETHRQLNNLKEVVVPEQESDDLKEERCEKYLKHLGFTYSPRLFPKHIWQNVSLPVFVTAVKSDQVHLTLGFVKSFTQSSIPDITLFIYDLGLDENELKLISKVCNSTVNNKYSTTEKTITTKTTTTTTDTNFRCYIRKFNFNIFPSHVSDLKLFAFRPIIIQEVLDQTGAALWLDAQYYFLPSASDKALKIIKQAEKEGILSWTINQPTSSLTHPRMFDYFNTNRDNYYFHRMIMPGHLLVYNTERIHNDLMFPWVKCALTPECIAPIGAQSSGCRFDKKPLYRYSGCHYYDTSAINVVLGVMYNYNEKPYAANDSFKFFKKISTQEANDIFTDDNDVDIDFGNLKTTSKPTNNNTYKTFIKKLNHLSLKGKNLASNY